MYQKRKIRAEKKNNKNMYLRVKKDGIHITCNYFVTKSMILSFINNNKDSIIKMNEVVKRKEEKEEEFYYLGNKYDVVILNTVSKIEFVGSQVFVKNKTYLKTIKRSYNYDLEITDYFDADIFYKLMKDIANKDNFNGFPKEFSSTFKRYSGEK